MTTNTNIELSMDEMETVTGGIAPLLIAIAVGVGVGAAIEGAKAAGAVAGWLAGGGSLSSFPVKDLA
jgi:lactobin A/cerein 7B family class IIb bacteriocin